MANKPKKPKQKKPKKKRDYMKDPIMKGSYQDRAIQRKMDAAAKRHSKRKLR